MSEASPAPVARAFRAIAAALFAVRIALLPRYLDYIAVQMAVPVGDSFFPALLEHPLPLALAFVAPLATEAWVLFQRPTVSTLRMVAAMELTAASVLLVHQATYYFATWVVVFWTAAFLCWLAWSAARMPGAAGRRGPLLAQLIVSFLFLGGAAGKWTAGYWSGAPFYHLMFLENHGFPYDTLRAHLDAGALATVAEWYSRIVVIVETGMAGVVLLPSRAAAVTTIVVALGLWFSSADLFEVAWPLVGLAAASWILSSSR